jgi:sialate O-acetylesterase
MSSNSCSARRGRVTARLLAIVSLGLVAAATTARARDFDHDSRDRLMNLAHEKWRFSVGDDARWAEPSFEDRRWARISVPDAWEDEGYEDYNGFAWYRCRFRFDQDATKATYLALGRIDDVDEVFVNGKKVGATGQFPPAYASTWSQDRVYALPAGTWKTDGDNVIAVRVYDAGGRGGITDGPIGIYTTDLPVLAVDFTGEWQFHPGDNLAWKEAAAETSGFTTMFVPAYWENSGHPALDGFAWYRKTFAYTPKSADQTMVLMLGRIDDSDEVYLNGQKIGGTGHLNDSDRHGGDYYAQLRGYSFPASLLQPQNVIAVRVYDHGGMGGIYEGPVGLIGQTDYIAYWEANRHRHHGTHALRSLLRHLSDE